MFRQMELLPRSNKTQQNQQYEQINDKQRAPREEIIRIRSVEESTAYEDVVGGYLQNPIKPSWTLSQETVSEMRWGNW